MARLPLRGSIIIRHHPNIVIRMDTSRMLHKLLFPIAALLIRGQMMTNSIRFANASQWILPVFLFYASLYNQNGKPSIIFEVRLCGE